MKPDRNSYTALDFMEWSAADKLALAPKFQRRNVWTTPKKSYLIDTILKDLPIPPIYLRVVQNEARTRTIREVIDGQQRLSAVLDFVSDRFRLTRTTDPSYAGKKHSELSPAQKDQIAAYAFNCETFTGISDITVIEIFTRMNTSSVQLSPQELRNGKYFGIFRQAATRVSHEHLEYWRRHKIVSERGIARMKDVELVSELLIAQLDGMQDKKKSLETFYSDYDEDFPSRDREVARLAKTLDAIHETFGDSLRDLQWHRLPLFYSLYCVTFHRMHGLPGARAASPKRVRALGAKDRAALADAAINLSDVLDASKAGEAVARKHQKFVTASQGQTDNIAPRRTRFTTLYAAAFGS